MTLFVMLLTACLGIGLIISILIQDPKGGTLLGGSSTQWVSVAQVQPALERMTWGFAAALLILCLAVF